MEATASKNDMVVQYKETMDKLQRQYSNMMLLFNKIQDTNNKLKGRSGETEFF